MQEMRPWALKMEQKFGADVASWPRLGCSGRFRPWAKGHSMVCEVKDVDDTWSAFIAARPSFWTFSGGQEMLQW